MKHKALVLLGFIFVISQTSLTALAATISVPGDAPDIQQALSLAKVGDRVELSPGIYFENNLVVPEGIFLAGTGSLPGDVVIDGGQTGRILHCESLLQSTSIENITFSNGSAFGPSSYDQSGGAIYAGNSSLKISNCIFSGNEADSHGGAIRSTIPQSLLLIAYSWATAPPTAAAEPWTAVMIPPPDPELRLRREHCCLGRGPFLPGQLLSHGLGQPVQKQLR